MLVFGRENWRLSSALVPRDRGGDGGGRGRRTSSTGSGQAPGAGRAAAARLASLLACSGGVIILFEMLLWPRKSLWRGWRLGRTKLWMTAHIWLGLLTLPLLLLHGGFHFSLSSSTLAAVLMWLLVLVVGSGLFGLVLQNILPQAHARAGACRDDLRADRPRPRAVSSRGRAVGRADVRPLAGRRGRRRRSSDARRGCRRGTVVRRPWGRCDRSDGLQGKMVQAEIEARWVPGSDALFTFYRDQIEPYLRARSGRRLLLGQTAQAAGDVRGPQDPPASGRPIPWWTVWPISAINAGSSISRRGCISGFTRGSALMSPCLWH